jgi:hypothetical protein
MILILRLMSGQHCSGCGAHDCYVDSKCLLCLKCMDFKIRTEEKRARLHANLTSTMAAKFAYVKENVRAKLREFAPARREY